MKKTLFIMSCIAMFYSCTKDLDFENLDNLKYEGEWAVPIVNVNLSLSNIVLEDSTFIVDQDGGLRIVFEEQNLYTASANELLEIPDQDLQEINLQSDMPPVGINTSLGTIAGAELKSFLIREGQFNWVFDNDNNYPAEVEFKIKNATLNGDTARFTFIVNGAGETTGVFDISSLDFDLTQGANGFNSLNYTLKVLNDGGAPAGTNYKINLTLSNLKVDLASGFFGNRAINIPASSVNPQISGFENFLSGLYLSDPNIEFTLKGNIGLPVKIAPDVDGVNAAGDIESLDLQPQYYNGPTNVGDWDTSKIVLNSTTSNIVDFIANVPNSIIYSGEIEINPNGNNGVDNFVTQDAEISVGIKLDLPLELRADDLILEQWIHDFDLGIEEEDADQVQKIDLYFDLSNGFPFDADLTIYIVDSVADLVLDSINVDLLSAAPINAQGRVTAPYNYKRQVTFTDQNIDQLLRANKLKIVAHINTTNNGNDIVKLYSDYFINVAFGVGAKLNLNLSQE